MLTVMDLLLFRTVKGRKRSKKSVRNCLSQEKWFGNEQGEMVYV